MNPPCQSDTEQYLPLTVLLVEDSEVDRQVYQRYLQTDTTINYQCLEVETLEEGLALYQQEQPDVTLLDFSLPDGDGLEFLTRLNDGIPDLKWPVVMLTGQGDERIAAKSIKLGAADYLVKQDLTATALQTAVVQTHQNTRLRQQLERSRQQETITNLIALKIRQSLDLQTILDGAVQEVQKNLKADRVLIYRLTPETDIISGEILAEAVVPPWTASLHQQVRDECLQASAIEKYHYGHAFVVNDVAASDLSNCHKQLLERFQVKANLAVPILFSDQTAHTDYLWGLLIAHQCGSPRQWNPHDVHFLQGLSVQLAIAINQAQTHQSLADLSQELEQRVMEIKQSEQAIQQMNQQLQARIAELNQRHEEMLILSEISDFLQACLTVKEASNALSSLVENLFPDCSGAIFITNQSRNRMEVMSHWGDALQSAPDFHPQDCWALRRGRLHHCEHHRSGLRCRHVPADQEIDTTLCIPMIAQSETLGLFYLSTNNPSTLPEAKRQIARTVAEQVALAISNLNLRETLQYQSIRDPLTGLYNRRYLEEVLSQEIARAQRKQHEIGVVMIDVDHFKRFNDTYSHEVGDYVLQTIATLLKNSVRGSDIVCRYGGEEMTLILPESSLGETTAKAEEIREAISKQTLAHNGKHLGNLTISLGIASFPQHSITGTALLQTADAALYRAKSAGRNQVVVAP
ncbi:MAG: phytochrome-like protein cph2 [Cyanobacteriota bacterium]